MPDGRRTSGPSRVDAKPRCTVRCSEASAQEQMAKPAADVVLVHSESVGERQ